MKRATLITIVLFAVVLGRAQIVPTLLDRAQQTDGCKHWVDSVFQLMNLREKVGQLFVYTALPVNTKQNNKLIREAVHTYKAGGILFSGGTLQNHAYMTNYAQSQAEVPLLVTFDGEWGLSMRLKPTPIFPKNRVLGCVQDEQLIYEYGREMARQCKELGIHVNFAPVADVNINPNNPVINVRSFGENPVNVANKVVAYASGLESGGVLSVAKHFPGHGDTEVDSHVSLPTLSFSRQRLDSVELYPFKQMIGAGLGGVMVGHLQVTAFDPDLRLPSSLSHNIIEGLLKQELKFNGLIFTDALAMKGVSSVANVCAQALKAGNDMVLTPRNIKDEVENVLQSLRIGELKEEDIDRKCRKVLAYKYALGIRGKEHVRLSGLESRINSPGAEVLIAKLRLSAVTVLGNERHLLPLYKGLEEMAILSVGDIDADRPFVEEMKKLTPITHYQLTNRLDSIEVGAIKQSLSKHKRLIVSISTNKLGTNIPLLEQLTLDIPTVYTLFTDQTVMNSVPSSFQKASAVVLAHSNEKEVQAHTARLLFGKESANGKLSMAVKGLYRVGDGVDVNPQSPRYYIPEEYGMKSEVLNNIEFIVKKAIREEAFPGCQVLVLKEGKPLYNQSFGRLTYGDEQQVTSTSMYDLASLSKTTGTLLAVMKLYDKGLFNLTDRVSDYLPFLKKTNKEEITISDLLLHESGLPPTILFYQDIIDPKSYKGGLFKSKRAVGHAIQVGENTFAPTHIGFKKGMTSSVPSDQFTLQVSDSLFLHHSFHEQAMLLIAQAPLKEKKYAYSCVNFMLLKELVETVSEKPMDHLLEQEFYAPLGAIHTGYLPLNRFAKQDVVPSVENDFLRGGRLQGYVHDESAAFMGGVSGNAGLFSTASDVAQIYQMLLNGGELNGKRYLSKETCRLFTTQTSKTHRRGLGFDKAYPQNADQNPCAAAAPASVYGHTGFTGTCAWVDPENRLVYVFLSNRTYPNRWNTKLSKMNVRSRIQEVIYESMK